MKSPLACPLCSHRGYPAYPVMMRGRRSGLAMLIGAPTCTHVVQRVAALPKSHDWDPQVEVWNQWVESQAAVAAQRGMTGDDTWVPAEPRD